MTLSRRSSTSTMNIDQRGKHSQIRVKHRGLNEKYIRQLSNYIDHSVAEAPADHEKKYQQPFLATSRESSSPSTSSILG